VNDNLIKVCKFNTDLNAIIGTSFPSFDIYRSKGLLAHLINRKHFTAAKYIDHIPEIISAPDYVGYNGNNFELIKEYKNNIFISIKLDNKRKIYYVATMFDVKAAKIKAYVDSGRLIRVQSGSQGP
jgi:hypothetical protein